MIWLQDTAIWRFKDITIVYVGLRPPGARVSPPLVIRLGDILGVCRTLLSFFFIDWTKFQGGIKTNYRLGKH